MVADYVVDSNVWAWVDKPISQLSKVELQCLQACLEWLKEFVPSADKLVVDLTYKILQEYRNQIKKGGLAEQWLNKVETQPRNRKLVELQIEFDDDGYAVVPESLAMNDKADRKFIAVALKDNPIPPIVNASDTDWYKDQDMLKKGGIQVIELCLDYIIWKVK